MVYANDIEEDYLRSIEKRCVDQGMTNVKTVLGSLTDPKLPPATLDIVIMVNVVHCLAEPVTLFRNIKKSLKPDGVIAIVEGSLEKYPDAAGEWWPRSKLLKIYKDAGYDLVREETFLPKDNIYFLKENMHIHRSITLLLVIAFLISGCGPQQAFNEYSRPAGV
jgi:SAM-dependent methyltransferase